MKRDNFHEILPYTVLLIRPILLGTIAATAWFFIHNFINLPIADQGVFEPILVPIGAIHGFLAAMQIQKVSDQQQKIKCALRTKNREMFDEFAYFKISPVIKLLLATFSIIFFLIFLIYPFTSIYSGIIIVWTIMFVLYLAWEIADELDDPFHGIWKVTQAKLDEAFGINTITIPTC